MTLVPFENYVLAAEKLISENPLGLKVSYSWDATVAVQRPSAQCGT